MRSLAMAAARDLHCQNPLLRQTWSTKCAKTGRHQAVACAGLFRRNVAPFPTWARGPHHIDPAAPNRLECRCGSSRFWKAPVLQSYWPFAPSLLTSLETKSCACLTRMPSRAMRRDGQQPERAAAGILPACREPKACSPCQYKSVARVAGN
jgi:hypothetical protein